MIWGLCSLWDIPRDDEKVSDLLISLGADVPVCFAAHDARIKGLGDVFEHVPALPELCAVLVHPGKPSSTPDVFKRFEGEMRDLIALPSSFSGRDDFLSFMKRCDNDLTPAAMRVVPEIENVLQAIEAQNDCLLSRMSGSGSSCFGIFAHEKGAREAAQNLMDQNPDWWVVSTALGRVSRY